MIGKDWIQFNSINEHGEFLTKKSLQTKIRRFRCNENRY